MNEGRFPIIPENITVHLGAPSDTSAENITLPFPEYIKNVASSEIYPTWPENALRANILAQLSFTLNRVYTEYYRSRGYDFDITNSTAIDQSFIPGRDVFENISQIVDEIFTDYISRRGNVEPLFAAYCDGIEVTCNGLSQWGSVSLAEAGNTPYEILTAYYGDDIDIITDNAVENVEESFPGVNLSLGSSGNDVAFIQRRLNRISKNYPTIPKITSPVGIFNEETDAAVRAFQEIFDLTPDGIVGRATWYKIVRIYNGVRRLSEVVSQGIPPEDVTNVFQTELSQGDVGTDVANLQYFLRFVAEFEPNVPTVSLDGVFGPATRASVEAFQRNSNLPVTGVVDLPTWQSLYSAYRGMLLSLPEGYLDGVTVPYPGIPLTVGSQGEYVMILQMYLNRIAQSYTGIPTIAEDGVFGSATLSSVNAFRRIFGIPESQTVGAVTWEAIADEYSNLVEGSQGQNGQYGGSVSE